MVQQASQLLLLLVVAQQVSGPVEEVEEGEGEREADARDDVDALGAGGKPAEPPLAAHEVAAALLQRRRHVHLAVAELAQVVAGRDEHLLKETRLFLNDEPKGNLLRT